METNIQPTAMRNLDDLVCPLPTEAAGLRLDGVPRGRQPDETDPVLLKFIAPPPDLVGPHVAAEKPLGGGQAGHRECDGFRRL